MSQGSSGEVRLDVGQEHSSTSRTLSATGQLTPVCLVDSTTSSTGVLILTYRPAREQ
jgi:hypothetical protein